MILFLFWVYYANKNNHILEISKVVSHLFIDVYNAAQPQRSYMMSKRIIFPNLIIILLVLSIVSCDSVTDLIGGSTSGNGGTTTTFTVTFNANGGSGTAPSPQSVNAGSKVTMPGGASLSKNGFFFGGWNTKADGSEINFPAGTSITPTGDITLYAKWDSDGVPAPTTHTVTFDSNGGTGTAPSPQTVNDGSSVTLPSQSGLSNGGFTFGGWNTKADGSGINFAVGESITPTGNISLYAQWDTTPISSVAIVVTAPVTNTAQDTTAYGTGNFTIGRVSWSPVTNNLFLDKQVYTATITLTANSGYTFPGSITATINGKNATISNNTGTVITLSYTFPATDVVTMNKFVANSYTGNDRIRYSFSYEGYDFYYIYLGSLANVPVFSFDAISHNGLPGTTYEITMTEQIRNSSSRTGSEHSQITRGVVAENTYSRTTGSSYDETNSSTWGVKAGVEVSAKIKAPFVNVEAKVKAEGSFSRYTSNTDSHFNQQTTTGSNSSSFQQTTSLTNTVQHVEEITRTTEVRRTWDLSYYKAGYYRYSLFLASDVYLYIIKDSKTGDILDYEFREYVIPNSPRIWELDYSEDASFRKSNSTQFGIDLRILDNLPKPGIDFGYPVASAGQWNEALNAIKYGGDGTAAAPKKYSIFVNGDFAVPGTNNPSFGSVQFVEVTLKGQGRLSLNSNGSILRVLSNYQKLIIDDELLTLQGRSGNNEAVLSVALDSTLELKNGVITGNTSGGVNVIGSGSVFIMSGGTISGNNAGSGGGVNIGVNATFTMNGGTISGNTTNGFGGGVCVGENSTFTMTRGTISGNTASIQGGGVFVYYTLVSGSLKVTGGIFTKTGGTITGYANDTVNGNVVKTSSGAVQSNSGHAVFAGNKRKETTAGLGVNLSYNGIVEPATFSGAWDI